jgi:hypothetical protein
VTAAMLRLSVAAFWFAGFVAFLFGQSLWRWLPSLKRCLEGSLQRTQMWPKRWKLQHCLKSTWCHNPEDDNLPWNHQSL